MKLDVEISNIMSQLNEKAVKLPCYHAEYGEGREQEAVAAYFVKIREDFDVLRRVLHGIGGSLILLTCGTLNRQDVTASLHMVKVLLEESMERVERLVAPSGMELHHKRILQVCYSLKKIFTKYALDQQLPFLVNDQIDSIFRIVQNAYETLKQTASFTVGLEMVSMETSCACGHNH